MPHIDRVDHSLLSTPDHFRLQLCIDQPEVTAWIDQHLQGKAREVTVELSARYFDAAERWGDRMPILKKSRLNIELAQQVPNIDPVQRWMIDLPIQLEASDRLAIGRLLRALVTVSKACV